MLEDYLNQDTVWEYVTDTNEYNEKITATDNINCRKEEGFKLVRDKTGTQVTSSAMYLTMDKVNVDDKLDSRLVIAINNLTGLDGEIEGYEVYVD
ncbi:MAG: hypothetical protein Q8936_01700 [Bacillota bacterium]|nr:hypothetical protein [Bacillota bacterium]